MLHRRSEGGASGDRTRNLRIKRMLIRFQGLSTRADIAASSSGRTLFAYVRGIAIGRLIGSHIRVGGTGQDQRFGSGLGSSVSAVTLCHQPRCVRDSRRGAGSTHGSAWDVMPRYWRSVINSSTARADCPGIAAGHTLADADIPHLLSAGRLSLPWRDSVVTGSKMAVRMSLHAQRKSRLVGSSVDPRLVTRRRLESGSARVGGFQRGGALSRMVLTGFWRCAGKGDWHLPLPGSCQCPWPGPPGGRRRGRP
jgi:hypothetical protein